MIGGAYSTTGLPEGPYVAFPEPIVKDELGCIDVNVIKEEETGKYFLLWKVDGNAFGKKTPMYLAELNEDGSKIIGESSFLITNDLAWENDIVEGGWLHYHNGYYYLFYSGNGRAQSYSVGVARSKNLRGPYIKGGGPILSQIADKAKGQYFCGPGHCSVVHIPSNNVDVMVYHSYISGKVRQDPWRIMLIDKIWWTEDGWPVVGVSGTPSHANLPSPISKEFADLPMDIRLRPNMIISLGSYQNENDCWESEKGTIDGKCNDKNNYYVVREGFMGPTTISLESLSRPGFFWRHKNSYLYLDSNDQGELFKNDASFIPVAGFEDQKYVSLRPFNFPFSCVRNLNGRLKMENYNPDEQDISKDSTWRINIKNK